MAARRIVLQDGAFAVLRPQAVPGVAPGPSCRRQMLHGRVAAVGGGHLMSIAGGGEPGGPVSCKPGAAAVDRAHLSS
jgi:hypothetical protein